MPSLEFLIGGDDNKGGFRSALRQYRGKENLTVQARDPAGRGAGKRIFNIVRIHRLE